MKLSHVDETGRARMVDVGDKPVTVRTAVAVLVGLRAFPPLIACANSLPKAPYSAISFGS